MTTTTTTTASTLRWNYCHPQTMRQRLADEASVDAAILPLKRLLCQTRSRFDQSGLVLASRAFANPCSSSSDKPTATARRRNVTNKRSDNDSGPPATLDGLVPLLQSYLRMEAMAMAMAPTF